MGSTSRSTLESIQALWIPNQALLQNFPPQSARNPGKRRGQLDWLPVRVLSNATLMGTSGRIQAWSAHSLVRAFLASDQVRAHRAVCAPVSPFLESTLRESGASRHCPAGPRSVPVRSAWTGTKLLTFCSPPQRTDMLRTGTVRGPGAVPRCACGNLCLPSLCFTLLCL